MTVIATRSFGGIAPKTSPRYLANSQAQLALNCDVFTGPVKPLNGLGASVAAATGITIYKFGQDSENDASGWLDWATDVDVARSQIAGDTEEWTFYTGDGTPKAIRAAAITSPMPMGLPFPASVIIPTLGADPADAAELIQETRFYTYTYVYKIGSRSIESAPAVASNPVDVYPTQSVDLAGMVAIEAGYTATHVRIYRSTAGTFLFVGELPLATAIAGYTDTVDPELLAEEIPSLTWLEPPDDLAGLTNIPNGIMAGFVGRDVYMCEPYVPHAWPDEYRQTVDYPVVLWGLAGSIPRW